MGKSIKLLLVLIVVAAIGTTGFLVFLNKNSLDISKNNNNAQPLSKRAYNSNIAENSEEIFNNHDELYSYVKKFGPKKTLQRLNALSAKFGSCHDSAHQAGRYAYDIYQEDSFKLCGAECHSGCYHGATEAYFRDHGTANLTENLNILCSSELNAFFSHQCIHGIGHGLMAWTSYDLPEALKSCDLLSQQKDSCWTGVFMENIVGGLARSDIDKGGDAAHFTKYLSEDPAYPCNSPEVASQYKYACYFLQTSRVLALYPGNFKKVAEVCSSAEEPYRQSCFGSMGRDAGGNNAHNAAGAIAACSNAPEGSYRMGCLMGAAQDAMWDSTGQDDAIGFCKLLTKPQEKSGCYATIFQRATEVFTSNDDLKMFCSKTESEYQPSCPTTL